MSRNTNEPCVVRKAQATAAHVALLAAIVSFSGCATHEKPAGELLANGDFNRGSQLWQSVGTVNAPGVFSTWRPTAGREKSGTIEIAVDPSAASAAPSWTCEIHDAPPLQPVAITGYVRGIGVTGVPGLHARVWSASRGAILAETTTELTSVPTGTFEWTPLAAVLDVPCDADSVELHLFLRGPGTVWFDDLSVRVVQPDAGTPN